MTQDNNKEELEQIFNIMDFDQKGFLDCNDIERILKIFNKKSSKDYAI